MKNFKSIKQRDNQHGMVDPLFIAVLIVLVAAAGVVFWQVSSTDETVSDTAANTENQSTIETAGAETAEQTEDVDRIPEEWVEYTNEELGVSFAYPKDWTRLVCDQNESIVYLGSVRAAVGFNDESRDSSILCGGGTDFPAQVTISEYSGETNFENSDLMIDDKRALRVERIEDDNALFPPGFLTVTYYIELDGSIVSAAYTQWPEGSDQANLYGSGSANLDTFDEIVTGTFSLAR